MSHAVTPEGIEKLRWNERPEKYRDLIRAVNELLEVGSYRNGRTLKVRTGDIIDLLEKWGSRPLPILGSNEFAFEDVYRAAGWKVTQIDGDLGYSSYWEFTPAAPGQKKLRIVKPRRPVAPRELGGLRGERFASEYPEVIDIVNNLLETNPDHDGTVIISTGDVLERLEAEGFSRDEILTSGMLSFIGVYRTMGWNVRYVLVGDQLSWVFTLPGAAPGPDDSDKD